MSPGSFEGTRKDLNRAIWRLGILEWVILAVTALFALGGGWLTALLVEGWGLPFRTTWTLASVLLFGIPGLRVLLHQRRQNVSEAAESDDSSPTIELDGQR